MKHYGKQFGLSEGYGIFRFMLVALLALANVTFTITIIAALTFFASFAEMAIAFIALFVVLRMTVRLRSPDYTLAWAIIMLFVPAAGLVLYFSWGRVSFSRNERGSLERSARMGREFFENEDCHIDGLCREHPHLTRQAKILRASGFPVYRGGEVEYLPLGESLFERMISDLEAAEDFILMSYYIIAPGELWDRIHGILAEKVKKGVTVRVMYDDFGCVKSVGRGFAESLRAEGMEAAVFNPIHRYVRQLYFYYRNHQKICVVDGKCAYLGGANIADEYINRRQRLGHWKDTGVRITGGGVRSVTVTFLQMWDMAARTGVSDYGRFTEKTPGAEDSGCRMIPFAGGPLYRPLTPAHDIYETMCETARNEVWYATPYLAPDSTLREAFCLAARGGVDIRIVTPAIPDHVTVFAATRGNYQRLLDAGVRIFEYTPGFMHAKMIVCDRSSAVVGSINIDTGSFHRQYENAVWFTGSPEVDKIAADFENIFVWCKEIKREEWMKRPLTQRFWEASMCLMSPLF